MQDYRRLIVEEAASFRAEKALARRLRAEKLASLDPSGEAAAANDAPPGDDEMGGAGAAPAQFF